MIRIYRLFIVVALTFWGISCSDLPRDPKDTLHHVQGGRLRVGLVERPPWVIRTNGEPAGAEVELIRRFAHEISATPEWHWGSEQTHMEALKEFELDLVVGGITDQTPWYKEVGLTSPYFKDKIMVGVPASMPAPKEIKGLQVAVKNGEATAAYLENKGAVPVRVDNIRQENIPLASPEWQLEKLGFSLTDIELNKEQHVMATPPGENGWIKRLDEFLSSQRPQIKNLLQQEESKQSQAEETRR